MQEILAHVIFFGFLAGGAIYALSVNRKMRRTLIRNRTLYRFCQTRRDLISLLDRGHLKVDGPIFRTLERVMSGVIHYYADFKFDSAQMLRMIKETETELKPDDRANRFVQEAIASQDEEVHRIIHDAFASIVLAYTENSLLLNIVGKTAPLLVLGKWLSRTFGERELPAFLQRRRNEFQALLATERIDSGIRLAGV